MCYQKKKKSFLLKLKLSMCKSHFTLYFEWTSGLAKNFRIFKAVEDRFTIGPSTAVRTTSQVLLDGNVSIQLRNTFISFVVLSSLF